MNAKVKKSLLIISLLVAISMILPFGTAFAALDEVTKEEAAGKLHTLGLLNGVGTNPDGSPDFALDRAATSVEAVVMAIKLSGKEADARNNAWAAYAPDAPDWVKSYLGFAYAKGLTENTGDLVCETGGNATAIEFVYTILQAFRLASETGFIWEEMLALANYIGGSVGGSYDSDGDGAAVFTRGDMIAISYSALSARCKGTNATLCSWLVDAGVVTEASAIEAGFLDESYPGGQTTEIDKTPVPEAAAPGFITTDVSQFESALFNLINAERAANGLGALDRNPVIAAVALAHSKDMAGRGYFSHINPERQSPSARMRAAGLNFTCFGEVLAHGQKSPEAVLAAWMNSPSHRDAILNAKHFYMGVGFYEYYWTVDFAG